MHYSKNSSEISFQVYYESSGFFGKTQKHYIIMAGGEYYRHGSSEAQPIWVVGTKEEFVDRLWNNRYTVRSNNVIFELSDGEAVFTMGVGSMRAYIRNGSSFCRPHEMFKDPKTRKEMLDKSIASMITHFYSGEKLSKGVGGRLYFNRVDLDPVEVEHWEFVRTS